MTHKKMGHFAQKTYVTNIKIYVIPVDKKFQQTKDISRYPPHNKDFGVEQDFLKYLNENPEILVDDPDKADFHYLPIYWTRWHVSHNYAKQGIEELKKEVQNVIIDDSITFTICQYADGPVIDLGNTILFLGSRKENKSSWYDIPLLATPLKSPILKPNRKYAASFVGRVHTHPIRKEIFDLLINNSNYYLKDGIVSTKKYTKKICQSYVALAPRGYGGSSFRLYEAMQLGTLPFFIGDIDTRPFKKYIDWEKISLFTNDPSKIDEIILSYKRENLINMGLLSQNEYYNKLTYGKWCKFVIQTMSDYL